MKTQIRNTQFGAESTVIPVAFGEASAQRWMRVNIRRAQSMSPERRALWFLIAGQILVILVALGLHFLGLC